MNRKAAAEYAKDAIQLSIPYWDFLVLNLAAINSNNKMLLTWLSIPYWDFLVLNHNYKTWLGAFWEYTFNSLLGFSSFESFTNVEIKTIRGNSFQFPIGIF